MTYTIKYILKNTIFIYKTFIKYRPITITITYIYYSIFNLMLRLRILKLKTNKIIDETRIKTDYTIAT